jgi:nucleotidyltransferase substrate binding protein (TIGR01987 family)
MNKEDIRWKQRFQNYQKSLNYLEDALAIIKPDLIQKAGLIQFFEMTFELAWNTMKDYLEEEGFLNLNSPRETIKKAFEIELITDGHAWLKALEDRNLTSHTYDEETASEVENLIRNNYYHLLVEFFKIMEQKL